MQMSIGGRKNGFTIVELLIVIVVVAILAVVSIVSYIGVSQRAYANRAQSELSSIARAVKLYYADKGQYPADVDRNIPVAIFDFSGDTSIPSQWPLAPWPGSIYDYDYFIGSDGNEVAQVSIRFCPLGGDITSCKFPREAWAQNFDVNSSAYWCITGKCRAHPQLPDNHPGYCINCKP